MQNGIKMEDVFLASNIVTSLKTDSPWNADELKIMLLVVKKLSEHSIFVNKKKDFNQDAVIIAAKRAPTVYALTKKEIMYSLNLDRAHYTRTINKIRKSLRTKGIDTPHPLAPDDKASGESLSWFTKISYLDKVGDLNIHLNPEAIDRLLILTKYTKLSFKHIHEIHNEKVLKMYLALKALKDVYGQYSLTMSFDELREHLDCSDTYRSTNMFIKKVIEVIEIEINKKTDLSVKFNLQKFGRSYDKVNISFYQTLDFDDKNEQKSDDDPITANPNAEGGEITQLIEEVNYENEKALLRSYGISVKAIEKYFEPLTGYQIGHIQQAIARLEIEIARGKIIANKPAYFATVLKSVVDDSQAILQAQAHEAEKQQRIEKSNKVKNAWDELDRYISSNDGYVLSIIDAFVRSIPIVSDEVIEVKDKITELYMMEDIGKIQIPFNALSKVITALGEKWSIGTGNIMLFMTETKFVSGDVSDKIKALKESLAFHIDMIETVEDLKLKAHHQENVALIKDKLLVFLM